MPFGVRELLAAVAGAERVLDAGCGSGRLTVALARTGADVSGFDTSSERLAQARERAAEVGVELRLVEGDFNRPLPFVDAEFDTVTSRLALMAAADPVQTLRELGRVLEPHGRLATALWARPEENPWFAEPRTAVATSLGAARATFARAFGKLGDPEEAADVHRAAGFASIDARRVEGQIEVASAEEHWTQMATRIGHFRRLDVSLSGVERTAVVARLAESIEPYRQGDHIVLPRALVLVAARR